jgi:hypothetical protein
MDKFDRIFHLHAILADRRTAIPLEDLMARLECSKAHAVRWAGVIKERLRFADYWGDRRFAKKKPGKSERPDNIYRPHPGGQGFVQTSNNVHGPEATRKDTGGQFVLVFDPVWRFVGGSPVIPADFGFQMLTNARRGHRVHTLDSAAWRRLRDWLDHQKQKLGVAAYPKSKRPCGPARSSSLPTSKSKPRRVC